jgi:threonine/homoserine/homoserine lactone efflux protein
MHLHTWLFYLLATTGLSLSPGPNGLLALTHGAIYGRRKALCTVLGGSVGFVTLIALSMFGIGALLKTSLVWLTVLKWLGVQVWRAPPVGLDLPTGAHARRAGSLFRQGALSALTNPKGVLFFAAFLPQFIDPAASLWFQFAITASTFVATEFATEMLIACMAQSAAPWLRKVGRRFNRLCGGIFVAVGAVLPMRA